LPGIKLFVFAQVEHAIAVAALEDAAQEVAPKASRRSCTAALITFAFVSAFAFAFAFVCVFLFSAVMRVTRITLRRA
jgi:hypothetical protein